VKCKFCNSNVKIIFENGVECSSCRTVSVINMPSDEEIQNYYLKFNQNYTGGGAASNQILYAKKYLNLVKKHFKKIPFSILDVGCSNSPFPNLISDSIISTSVYVLDVVKPLNLNSNITFNEGLIDNSNIKLGNLKFDIITAWAVIEHVKDVDISFSNISQLLNKNGHLFLTTPEIGTFFSNFNLGKTPWFFPPEHLHILSSSTMENIAKKYNLTLIKKGHFEISKFRYFIRYYFFGLIETIIGLPFYFFSKKTFDKLKMQRVSSYKGIQYLIFKKN
jgi:2-polyprenyl-3-methyl-5-hydroxy-6-metoxy-1,4-benzoquinol methylase